jgi:hypothetical protein
MPQLFYAGNAVRRKRPGQLLRVIRREAKDLGNPARHSTGPEVPLAAASALTQLEVPNWRLKILDVN